MVARVQANSAASTSSSTTPASTSASRRIAEIEEWDSVIETNLTSAFLCSQAVYPAMKQAGGGKIINIGSMMSIFGASFAPAYAASKGGIVQFTRSCACAWAPTTSRSTRSCPAGSTPI
jgi:2-deoxy-D-gluconate 3-dehydrogenase